MDASDKNRLLIIDDEDNMLHMLSAVMRKEGYDVVTAANGRQGLDYALATSFDFILCDLKMPQMDGLAFLGEAKNNNVEAVIIMMSAYATVDTAVKAMKIGAYDFITKPFKIDEIVCILEKAAEYIRIKKENILLKDKVQELQGNTTFSRIIGNSPEIRKIIEQAQKVAEYETSVLITGESGTGKELIAQGIHSHSKRSAQRLITVNCGSIPENLLESEFFGYVKGAFTGADTNHIGLFEAAEGGTLFLDEIGELPIGLQVKLLRVLQEHEVRPIGSSQHKKVNVRVVAATAKNLSHEVDAGRFRRDLLFRLNVVELTLPPLRDRKEDILLLAQHFMENFNQKFDCRIQQISREAKRLLMRYEWPGNIRELENVIERGVIYAENSIISPISLPDYLLRFAGGVLGSSLESTYSLKEGKKIMERFLITKALTVTEGNKSQAALLLEISYPSLLGKIKEFEIVCADL